MISLTEEDKTQLKQLEIPEDKVNSFVRNFEEGFPSISLENAATTEDGILDVTGRENTYIDIFEKGKERYSLLKFVPASGAASRMFKALFAAKDKLSGLSGDQARKKVEEDKFTKKFFTNLSDFAFYERLAQQIDITTAIEEGEYGKILEALLDSKGLNYGKLPKGLLDFHKYEEGAHTPFEEHLVEGAQYAESNGIVRLHFTVSPEHKTLFETLAKDLVKKYEDKFGVSYQISFSEQKKRTDTLAVDPKNQPFRKEDHSILFRPGGHGALIENLNDLKEDIVFIKNIDNVVPENRREITYTYKKVLGGVLMELKDQIKEHLTKLKNPTDEVLEEVKNFIRYQCSYLCSEKTSTMSNEDRADYYKRLLHRPARVCGMVKNQGEPGGGPFWTKNEDGSVSLQIVESAQMDMENTKQKEIVNHATHFNPVDLVCSLTDPNGKELDLTKFVDPKTGFISEKSLGGRNLKALELPGLWNGAMADWNTIFVQVPIETFNPVKTVNDLLRPEHQG